MALNTFIVVENGAAKVGPQFDPDMSSLAVDNTINVQASGGDSTTIQGGIDLLDDSKLGDDNVVVVEAGIYNEFLDFASIYGRLILRGDTRNLAGLAYTHEAPIRSTDSNAGAGTCTLNKSGGSQITVTGSSSNPDFDADGWVAGDKVFILTDTGTLQERTIDTVTNNVIDFTQTVNNPASGSNHGGMIVLCPNRRIMKSSGTGPIFDVKNPFLLVEFEGFCIESVATDTGTLPDGMCNVSERAIVHFNNCILKEDNSTALHVHRMGQVVMNAECSVIKAPEDGITVTTGLIKAQGVTIGHCDERALGCFSASTADFTNGNFVGDGFTVVRCNTGSTLVMDNSNTVSTAGTSSGVTVARGGKVIANDAFARKNTTSGTGDGYQATLGGVIIAENLEVDRYNAGVDITRKSQAKIDGGTVTNTSIAVFSDRDSYISALNTLANMSGNSTDYSPGTSDVVGNIDSLLTFS